MSTAENPSAWDDWGKLLLRWSIGVLLLLHGIAKMKNGVAWMAGPLSAAGLPFYVAYGAYVGEVIAPILLIAGKYARLAGLVVAFHMMMAIILVRRRDLFAINQGGGWAIELEALFLLGGLAIFLLGSGRYSLSRGIGRWD